MKVILLQDIKGLGKKFDVKNAADGYVRNFLLPRKLAKIATGQSIKELENQKAAWQKHEEDLKKELEHIASNLSGKEFKFHLKTGDRGEVFGSITENDIKEKLSLPDAEIKLDRPIKKLGEHQVEINLGKGIKTSVKIVIEPQ